MLLLFIFLCWFVRKLEQLPLYLGYLPDLHVWFGNPINFDFCLVFPKQAKKLVESLPQEIRANVSKEEAEKLKAALEAAGGTVVLE